ncbi:MAG: MbnH family di-heme enzyme [Nannocystales bacterium]
MTRTRILGVVFALAACGDAPGTRSTDGSSGSTAEAGSTTASSDGGASSESSGGGTTSPRATGSSGSSGADSSETSTGAGPLEVTPWEWALPPGFPQPVVPQSNPMTVEGVELGRHLFFDTRLSVDGTYACSSCHDPESAFTDGLAMAEGVTGQIHTRGSMSLANVAYAGTLAWANPELLDLETHALVPMFGTEPVEMGLIDEDDLVSRIASEPVYDELFAAAYPTDADPITLAHVTQALASFQRSLISGRAPFDRWFFEGDEEAISEAAKRGWDLFNVPGECTYCHFGFNFSNASYFEGMPQRPLEFHNTALYNEDGQGGYPAGNEGLYAFSGEDADMGKFKSPTLRNIAVTAPYMHDGSIATLEEMLEHYSVGGRVESPNADHRMRTFTLKDDEVADLIAFFESLTDDAFLTNPAHADPWVGR